MRHRGRRVRDPRVVPNTDRGPARPGAPRSPAAAASLVRFDHLMTLPLVLSAVLPLFLTPGGQRSVLVAVVNVVAWVVFVVDLVVHGRLVDRYLSTWIGRFDLAVVVLTAPWFLVVGPGGGQIVLLIRLARLARVVMAGPDLRRLAARIGRVVLVVIGVILLGAAAAYAAEHPTNPQFADYGDSLWWAVVTLTTVGYGDIVPITTDGRLVGVMIMVAGIGVIGVLSGSLASFFRVGAPTSVDAPESEDPDELLRREVIDLRSQVERLSDGISGLLGQQAELAAGDQPGAGDGTSHPGRSTGGG